MKRPNLDDRISIDDFKNFYWLKEELTKFCKSKGISTSGSKLELADRIKNYLSSGEISKPVKKIASTSTFDWNNAPLTLNTKLTDNYKNSENVRAFMTKQIGSHFRFNTLFMQWAKSNVGKPLKDAIDEWNRIYALRKDKNYKTKIAPQFEYNTYMRDFLADNPDKSAKDAMKFWKLKRNQRGDNKYAKSDLLLIE